MAKRKEDFVYSLYKPLCNQLNKYNLWDSLYVIWGYSRNLTFNHPFPSDIDIPYGFNPNGTLDEKRYRGIPEYEQEFLVKEIIINCQSNVSRKSLKDKKNLSKLINYVRTKLSEKIDEKYLIENDILLDFNRLSHRQFKWQTSNHVRHLYRYYKLYENPILSEIIKRKFNLSVYQIFILGIYFSQHTANKFCSNRTIPSNTKMISDEMIETFLTHFSMSINQAKRELHKNQQINRNIFYSYNPLVAKPILTHSDFFVCPIPQLLFLQFTEGIYYSIFEEKGFENAYGESFENYIGEVINRSIEHSKFQIIKEEKYLKNERKSSDWIIIDDSAILFVECKTKRMTMNSKTSNDLEFGIEKDLQKMASFVYKVYKTYLDYTKNLYSHIKYDPSKQFIPLVITLEPWYINFNPRIMEKLYYLVLEEFKINNLSHELINEFPYYIRSSYDFEKDIQLINSLGINTYFEKVVKNELNDYIKDFNFQDIFKTELEKIFLVPVK